MTPAGGDATLAKDPFVPFDVGLPERCGAYESQSCPDEQAVVDRGRDMRGWEQIHDAYGGAVKERSRKAARGSGAAPVGHRLDRRHRGGAMRYATLLTSGRRRVWVGAVAASRGDAVDAELRRAGLVNRSDWHQRGMSTSQWVPGDNERKESLTIIRSERSPAMAKAENSTLVQVLATAQRSLTDVRASIVTLIETSKGLHGARVEVDFHPTGAASCITGSTSCSSMASR